MSLRGLFITLGGLLVLVLVVHEGRAQNRPDTTAADTTVAPDTATTDRAGAPPAPDTSDTPADAQRPDQSSSDQASSSSNAPNGSDGGSAQDAVTFSARDSMVIRTSPSGQDHGTLHGDATMSYREASLRARTIEMDFQNSTLRAEGAPSDSIRGDRALFQRGGSGGGTATGGSDASSGSNGGQSFTGDVLSYNLNNRRGRVVAARTQRQDGYVEGSAVKMFEDSTLFVQDGSYTTCNCAPGETPSYSLRSDEMKIADEWVYTGPIQLYLFDVPTPLWLPIGFLPNTPGRRSGPLSPNYGEDNRGFFIKDWGWYFALNPYTDLTVRAGVWSQGSYEINPQFRYKKRYKYDGNLNLTYQRTRIGEEEDPDFQNRHEGQLVWSHKQDFSPTSDLNADVDLFTSSDFSRRNSDNFDDAVRQEVSSQIRYHKGWKDLWFTSGQSSLNLNASQNQNLQSGRVRLTLPEGNFSTPDIFPFRSDRRSNQQNENRRWFEQINTSYRVNFQNRYNFTPRDPERLRRGGTPADSALADSIERADIDWYEALFDRDKHELATGDERPYNPQATHNIPVRATFRLEQYNLGLTPRIDYRSEWRINTTRKTARRDSTGNIDEIRRTVPGFYARHNFETGLTARSEVFGTFPIGLGPFQGLRHRLSPDLSINYKPNFNDPFWGRTRTLRFPDGTPVRDPSTGEVQRYDIVGGNQVQGSNRRLNLQLNLSNDFQTKRIRTDTTGTQSKEKITLLNLDVSNLSYDFAKDSLQVGDPRVSARTQVEPFRINADFTFSPYGLRRPGPEQRFRPVDQLMITESPFTPVRLTNFSTSISARFSSEASVSAPAQNHPARSNGAPSNSANPSGTGSSSLNIPWSLSLDFRYSLSKPRKEITNRSATLGADVSLNVTPLWRMNVRTGYDFMQEEISTTNVRVERAFCCWDMSFSWVPFGEFQQYNFTLQVSSGQLSELLKLPVPSSGEQGRFGGLGDQFRGAAQDAAGSDF